MKKILAMLLAAMLLTMTVPALADGTTTDKAINFLNFNYGDTFASIRSNEYIHNIQFRTEMMMPRNLADVNGLLADWSRISDKTPVCFSSSLNGREVAGYYANPSLWFVYPVVNGASVINEAEAVFYAGEYEFYDDANTVYNDLKNKLTQLYGEPHTVGKSLDGALGAANVPEDRMQEYAQRNEQYDASYTVWISTANNAALVLKMYKEGGDFERTKLNYISLDAADMFAQIDTNVAPAANNSFEGL